MKGTVRWMAGFCFGGTINAVGAPFARFLGITAGATVLTPPSIPVFKARLGGPPQTSAPILTAAGGPAVPYALTVGTASGGKWLSVSALGGGTGGSFMVTVTLGSLGGGICHRAVNFQELN